MFFSYFQHLTQQQPVSSESDITTQDIVQSGEECGLNTEETSLNISNCADLNTEETPLNIDNTMTVVEEIEFKDD